MPDKSDELILKFDPNTIEHLGISLYSKLPSVISELISNSWDADADEVFIDFRDSGDSKEIYYKDNGQGMSFDELNAKYLLIGRNRRKEGGAQETPKGRKVIGKKGLGKLSVFGICNMVEISTVKDGVQNRFSMNIEDIKKSKDNQYKPNIIEHNIRVKESNGTEIWLKEVRRQSRFKPGDIALGLSKKFLIFDMWKVQISHNGKEPIEITNELKFSGFKVEFTWKFPDEMFDSTYKSWKSIKGEIYTLETPIKDTEMKGVYLTSRGKIVNTAGFYGLRDTDQFHGYVTGYLQVDFIDDLDVDLISTDRHSLNWEHDVTRELQGYIQKVIKKIGSDWKKKRSERKKENLKIEKGLDFHQWSEELPEYEKELANKIVDPILENQNIDIEESGKIISNVMDKFQSKVFKDYASQIAATNPQQMPTFLKLMEDWKIVEAKHISDLAISRIEVIKQFEEHLDNDTKEVPTLHNFLKNFSWLLDPRILEFRDEITYSRLLKENFPENKRIDFLCSNALGGVLYVIEIKRSKYKVDASAMEQAYKYKSFLVEKYATQGGFSNVVCYVVGGEKSSDGLFKSKEKTYMQTGEIFVKTYRELLEQSKRYHQEFIDVYEKGKSGTNKAPKHD